MNERYYSLDVFRGATVALMILVNNPGSWEHIFPPLDHSPWNGCTPTDLVFPFFLFAVGNAFAFVMPKMEQKGSAYFLKKIVKRSIIIFLIGILLQWSPFLMYQNGHLVGKPWTWFTDDDDVVTGVRILGVLQRIALCYFFAALIIYYFKPKVTAIICIGLLLLYWWMCYTFGTKPDPYSLQHYFGIPIDKLILGEAHMYKGEGVAFDPEGICSTLTAIIQVIFGYFAGRYIRTKGKNFEMLSQLFIAGILLMFAGYCWDMIYPINKKIWTSSYTIYTTGLAMVTLGILIYFIEFKNAKNVWSKFFNAFGRNPLFIFILSGFLPRVLRLIRIPFIDEYGDKTFINPFEWFYEYVCKPLSNIHFNKWIITSDLRIGSLIYALCLITFYWSIAYWMDKRKVYIKV